MIEYITKIRYQSQDTIQIRKVHIVVHIVLCEFFLKLY